MDVPLVATNDVHYHEASRRVLQDVVTCIREKCKITEAGYRLAANSERHLKAPSEMTRLFQNHPQAIDNIKTIVERCTFSLDELSYNYPNEPVPHGKTPQQHLEDLTWQGVKFFYPDGLPDKVRGLIDKEFALISKLKYAPYFLTVHDIVTFAQQEGILLDPCYTGKAFLGLHQEIMNGRIPRGSRVLFWHTGGGLGTFAYQDEWAEVV